MELNEMELYGDKYSVMECNHDEIEMYQVKMFYYQHISGVRNFRYSMNQHHSFLYYDEELPSLRQVIEDGLEKDLLHRILEQIKLIIESGDNYLLYRENFLLDPDLIHIDQQGDTLKVYLMYAPLKPGIHQTYIDKVLNLVNLLAKTYNEQNDMEGFYYFIRLSEGIKTKEDQRSFVIQVTDYLACCTGNKKVSV